MTEKLLQIVLSFGFIKWLWDGAWFLWNKLYRKCVTADCYVAYSKAGSDGILEKHCFLLVRNGMDVDVVVDTFVLEDHWWYRLFTRPMMTKVVVAQEIMKVPANRSYKCPFFGNLKFYRWLIQNTATSVYILEAERQSG